MDAICTKKTKYAPKPPLLVVIVLLKGEPLAQSEVLRTLDTRTLVFLQDSCNLS